MVWVKIDDHFDEHPKMDRVGPLGWGYWLAGLAYCNRNLTDGFIPWGVARRMGTFEVVEADGRMWTLGRTSGMSGDDVTADWIIGLLLDAGLWQEVANGQGRIEGYQVHDFLDYNPSRSEVESKREQDRRRKRASPESPPAPDGFRAEPERIPEHPVPVPVPVPVPSPPTDTEGEGGKQQQLARTRATLSLVPPVLPPIPRVEATGLEQQVLGYIRGVPGLDHVPDDDILYHLRSIANIKQLRDDDVRFEAMKFRDYWIDKRTATKSGSTGPWRGWKNGLTTWFQRARCVDRGAPTPGRQPPRRRHEPDFSGIQGFGDDMRAAQRDSEGMRREPAGF